MFEAEIESLSGILDELEQASTVALEHYNRMRDSQPNLGGTEEPGERARIEREHESHIRSWFYHYKELLQERKRVTTEIVALRRDGEKLAAPATRRR